MADKTKLPASDEREKPSDSTPSTSSKHPSKGAKNGDDESQADLRQRIFADRFSETMDAFGEACQTQNVQTAIAIAVHPNEEFPLVFVRGHEYEIAVLLTRVLRNMKGKLLADLDV